MRHTRHICQSCLGSSVYPVAASDQHFFTLLFHKSLDLKIFIGVFYLGRHIMSVDLMCWERTHFISAPYTKILGRRRKKKLPKSSTKFGRLSGFIEAAIKIAAEFFCVNLNCKYHRLNIVQRKMLCLTQLRSQCSNNIKQRLQYFRFFVYVISEVISCRELHTCDTGDVTPDKSRLEFK